jgi:cytochrome oxidase Cu insertion factor (SCO1/SenC/PrrC family)/thiol-disulfide isomerase/thioredoxin
MLWMWRWARSTVAVLTAMAAVGLVFASIARADGDPGSDVLVYQDLFAGSDAGLSVQQQLRLGGLLKTAARAGLPVRVAIIASPFDLGAVTALWRNPRGYARFLGLELSLAYKQRLLVVMPNGFGFNWPGHSSAAAYRLLDRISIGNGGSGLFAAVQTAVTRLAGSSGVKLPVVGSSSSASVPSSGASNGGGGTVASGHETENVLGIVVLALVGVAAAGLVLRRLLGKRGWPVLRVPATRRLRLLLRRRVALPAVAVLVVLAGVGVILAGSSSPAQSQAEALATNPYLDPGTPLSGPAPDFTLSDQFGQQVSLHSFRGKVVILAFNDSECTTECPLTTTAMMDAKAMLGKAASQVQLLGVDANPDAFSLEDVWSYSELHGMLRAWHFLTGSLPQLKRVWKEYAVEAAVDRGEISHTPALFVIDPHGRKAKIYVTQMSYTAVGQLGQLLAQEASRLLPDHPAVHSDLSYARVPPTTPSETVTVPRAGGGTVTLGPGKSAHLFLFFATWDQETSGLAGQLDALNRYQSLASRAGLPQLTAVDEGSVEPGQGTLTSFLQRLPHPLSYPVAIDRSGKLADGYEVLGEPWFVLVSASGQLLYYRAVSTAGWASTRVLVRYVRAALARAPKTTGAATAQQQLAGSPPPLAAVHQQAGQLLGSQSALTARLRALRGYPVVINAWASWCGPCREEFGLLAYASAHYGRRIAFLGADTDDSAGDARTFLAQHPVSYPSYQTSTSSLGSLAVIEGLPTTIFIDRTGRVVYVHTGQYDSQGTLDEDIQNYGLG